MFFLGFLEKFSSGKYLYYPGVLPGGIIWSDTRAEIEDKLGQPVEEHQNQWVQYNYPGCILWIRYDYQSHPDPNHRWMECIRFFQR
jgi:hypothetical protein